MVAVQKMTCPHQGFISLALNQSQPCQPVGKVLTLHDPIPSRFCKCNGYGGLLVSLSPYTINLPDLPRQVLPDGDQTSK